MYSYIRELFLLLIHPPFIVIIAFRVNKSDKNNHAYVYMYVYSATSQSILPNTFVRVIKISSKKAFRELPINIQIFSKTSRNIFNIFSKELL